MSNQAPHIMNTNLTHTTYNIYNNGEQSCQQIGTNNTISCLNSMKEDVEDLRQDVGENAVIINDLKDDVQQCGDNVRELKLELKSYKNKTIQLSRELEESREESRHLRKELTENGNSLKQLRDDFQKFTRDEGKILEKSVENGVTLKICETIYGVRGYMGEIRVDRELKIKDVKRAIGNKYGCTIIKMCRTKNDKYMPDEKTLKELNIKEGVNVTVYK